MDNLQRNNHFRQIEKQPRLKDQGSAIRRVLEESLEVNSADIMEIGHTVSIESIAARLGGRVVMIDTGMSECYRGTARYLVLDQRGYKVHLP